MCPLFATCCRGVIKQSCLICVLTWQTGKWIVIEYVTQAQPYRFNHFNILSSKVTVAKLWVINTNQTLYDVTLANVLIMMKGSILLIFRVKGWRSLSRYGVWFWVKEETEFSQSAHATPDEAVISNLEGGRHTRLSNFCVAEVKHEHLQPCSQLTLLLHSRFYSVPYLLVLDMLPTNDNMNLGSTSGVVVMFLGLCSKGPAFETRSCSYDFRDLASLASKLQYN